jgi:hypothetical protein
MFLLEMQEHESQWLINEFEEENLKRGGNCKKKLSFLSKYLLPSEIT